MTTVDAVGDSRTVSRQHRRDELADAAIVTLAELGYARASLREIAERSALSHGSVHYFFADKNELIGYAVRRYKFMCATRYDEIVAATTSGQLRTSFAEALAATMTADAELHRLWYDVRHQAMFEPALRGDVLAVENRLEQMVANVLRRYEGLEGETSPRSAVDERFAYPVLDGVFERALLRHLAGDPAAAQDLITHAVVLLGHLYGRPMP